MKTDVPKIILDDAYDIYNSKMLSDNICGTITAHGHLGWRNVGTYLIFEEVDEREHNNEDYRTDG